MAEEDPKTSNACVDMLCRFAMPWQGCCSVYQCACCISHCQDDLMMGMLSVRENLAFSAALRLPSHTSRQQRRERVEMVIKELGLESCADTKVRPLLCYWSS